MIKNNKNTLEYGQIPAQNIAYWSKDIVNTFMNHLGECSQLKCLHLRISSRSENYDNMIASLCTLLESKIKASSSTVPLEELEIPLPTLYPGINPNGSANKLRHLLESSGITSSLRRLVLISPSGSNVISPRTFDNIIAKLTGLTSLSITLNHQISFDASEALAKLVNLQQLEVFLSHPFPFPQTGLSPGQRKVHLSFAVDSSPQ
jgi:hypothetical protein